MKLIINLSNFTFQEVFSFDTLPGVSHNGQHPQLHGHALVTMQMNGAGHTLSIFHPDTGCNTGHIDVVVHYKQGKVPTFTSYSNQDFTPCAYGNPIQNHVWPTGGWSLIQTLLAVETFLHDKLNYPQTLRDLFFESLQKAADEALQSKLVV